MKKFNKKRRRSNRKRTCKPNWTVCGVCHPPEFWWMRPRRDQIHYFYPECHNNIDPAYDFRGEYSPNGTGDWFNEIYPHQAFSEPPYDGILFSRVGYDDGWQTQKMLEEMGIHRFLRVPPEFPVFGDCGAFSYMHLKKPPYETNDLLDYYTRLGFDYGVSIDHVVKPVINDEEQRLFRYQLTIHNAEEFILEHRRRGLTWEPVGVVQGWDAESYARAARWYVAMGYHYLAFGGIARKSTAYTIGVLKGLRASLPPGVKIHLFGVARPEGVDEYERAGVFSFDSLSYFKQAIWGSYVDPHHSRVYTAIRMPEIGRSHVAVRRMRPRLKKLGQDIDFAIELEADVLRTLRRYDRGKCTLDECLDAVMCYEALFRDPRAAIRRSYRELLRDMPWKKCDCELCQKLGIEIVLSRGKQRTFRCGFHNTYIFYRAFRAIVEHRTL